MSTQYFRNFERILYRFGDNEDPAIFQNITQYIDLFDQIKADVSFYEDYTIRAGDRPDTVSFKLYGTSDYYWTFFLMNDSLRESGWPVASDLIRDRAAKYYPHRIITTKYNRLAQDFPVGANVRGDRSGTVGVIVSRNLDLGQLVIDSETAFTTDTETVSWVPNTNGFASLTLTETNHFFSDLVLWTITKDGQDITATTDKTLTDLNKTIEFRNIAFDEDATYELTYFYRIYNTSDDNFGVGENLQFDDGSGAPPFSAEILTESAQYLGTHHYEDSDKNWVDIDPFTQVVPSGATKITYLDRLEAKNEDLKKIKVLKSTAIGKIVSEFNRLLS